MVSWGFQHIWELAGWTLGTETLESLDPSVRGELFLWLWLKVQLVSVSSDSRTHRQVRVGLTLLLLLQSMSIPVRVPKCPCPYPPPCVHAFIWKHLQDPDFPSPSPTHESWFGCYYFPGFRNVCGNMLHSVCGPGGEHVAFSFIGGSTEPFVLNSLGVQLLKQSLCHGYGVR